jgi:putative oxidoreductase
MFRKILQTDNDISSFVLRLLLGIVFFPHGMQKVFGWFGGAGFSGTMEGFMEAGIPALFAFLAIVAESAGSIALITGFLTRIAAFGITCNMVVAVLTVHAKNGFFMNWTGTQKGEGFEFHILVIAITIDLMIGGGGRWSVDRLLSKKS